MEYLELTVTMQMRAVDGKQNLFGVTLTALPLAEQGFHLSKQEFWDALHLRYDWKLESIPSHCVCGAMFSPDHAMICKHGGPAHFHSPQ